jgi:hypothetical protein
LKEQPALILQEKLLNTSNEMNLIMDNTSLLFGNEME